MKDSSKHLLMVAGLVLGLAGGITIGVTQADEMKRVSNMPREAMLKLAAADTQQSIIPMEEIIRRFEKDGNRVTEIELDREFMRDVYELEVIDANGLETDIDVDARTGDVLKSKVDRD